MSKEIRITPYIKANTLRLDFHDLNVPPADIDCHIAMTRDEKVYKKMYGKPFCIFAKENKEELYVYVSFELRLLEGLHQYFHVERCGGQTPTQMIIVYKTVKTEPLLLTGSVLTEIAQRVLENRWEGEDFEEEPLTKQFCFEQEDSPVFKYLPPIGSSFECLAELLYKFNFQLHKRHCKEITLWLEESRYDCLEGQVHIKEGKE